MPSFSPEKAAPRPKLARGPASAPAVSLPVPTPHLGFIDGIRALAALFVMACHAYYEPTSGYYAGKIMNHLGLTYGHLAVDIFIVVSGFCLMLPVTRHGNRLGSLARFFQRRARRILPPYYAALLLSSAFILLAAHQKTGTMWDKSLPLTWPQFLAHAALIQDLPLSLRGGDINYPLWSIAVECQVYLFMPLVVLSLHRWGSGATAAWAVSFGLLLHIGLGGRLDSAAPWYVGLFAMGAIAARECVRVGETRVGETQQTVWRWAALLITGAVGGVLLAKGNKFFQAHVCYIDLPTGLAAALFIAATYQDVLSRKHWATRFLSWKPLVRIGLFSYSIYLVHAPLLHWNNLLLTRFLHPHSVFLFLLLLGSTPLIVLAAYGFHLLFERPFMKALPSRAA